QRLGSLGDVLIVQPIAFHWYVGLAMFTATAMICFAIWGEYTTKTSVAGFLVSDKGLAKICPPANVIISGRHVVEGQYVHRGDLLFSLSFDRTAGNGRETNTAA